MSKKRKIKILLGDDSGDIADMFNQMIGAGRPAFHIAYPRYLKLDSICTQLLSLMRMFAGSPLMTSYAEEKAEIDKFIEWAGAEHTRLFSQRFGEDSTLAPPSEEDQDKFAQVYADAKKSDLVNSWVLMCDRLVPYKRHLSDVKNLSAKFILTMPGVEFCPFQFTRLNIKNVICAGVSELTKEFILLVLAKAFSLSYSLYHEIILPDVEIDDFVNIVIKNITELQKRPELSRCGKAFKKIISSVHILKENFSSYYRDFVQSQNSMIMIEHFVLDVTKEVKADPETMRQFREIVKYYRKVSKDQANNPRVKSLLDNINMNLDAYERGTRNLGRKAPDGESVESPERD